MNALRLAAVATAAALITAAVVGACNDVINITDCAVPTLDEKGADGGVDPCHCDPSPSLNIMACGCLSDPTDQQSIDDYENCIFSFHGEEDAGGEGGP
jgi:hypothetical protein